MATKTDRPGLLSKMALFVRNPTKDWSELDRPQVEQDTGYDKQGLKAMIERKRQNDFVRKREFDQLRKLRSRGVTAVAGLGRPSVFQSSLLTDPDGRAVTLKKIDEIEAQMSKQWWKGKQDASIAQGVSFPVASPVAPKAEPDKPKAPVLPEPLSVTEQFSTTAAFDSRTESVQPNASEFVSTQMGDGMDSVPSRRALSSRRSALRKRPNAGDGTHGQDTDGGFSTSNMFAIDVEDMATDPELEEAAIRFANGDDEGAEKGLLSALRSSTEAPGSANAWAAALLDLYRATRNKAGFDSATSEFAHCFEAVVPHWQAIGEEPAPELSPQPTVASAPDTQAEGSDHAVGAIWSSPAELVAQSMEELRDAMASNPTPWHMDWSRLVRISDDAMPLMGGLFSSLCSEPVALRFSGAQKLVDTLQAMTPSGNQDVPSDWWSVRLNVLRTLQMLDEFELAALDYCVTYEHGTFHGTTIISVRRKTPQGIQVAIGGDGQVTLGNIIVKGSARKVRKLHHGKVLAGFAGATADAFTLFERFEAKLEKHQGHLVRAAIELTKDWRTDRVLRRLEAMLAVADKRGLADHHRQRRRSGARARHRGHRFRWRLCASRAALCWTIHRTAGARHRQALAGDRRRTVHLHQHAAHHRDVVNPKRA
jgi:hypothetical protein